MQISQIIKHLVNRFAPRNHLPSRPSCPCLVLEDNFVFATCGSGGHRQWLLRVDSSGTVVQRRAFFEAAALARFIGADMSSPPVASTMASIVKAWYTAQNLGDIRPLLEQSVC